MKRFGLIVMLLMLVTPAWAAKKITVAQLEELLHSLQQAKKTDAEVADQLRQVELTEELTRDVMERMAGSVPGPLTTEYLYVLEASSAMLAPPQADLPSTPAPDAAAQKALLDKAVSFATTTYAQLPHLSATKTAYRFQDHLEPPTPDTAKNTAVQWSEANKTATNQFIQYISANQTQVESQNGAEILSKAKDPTPWGSNGQITLPGQRPVLSAIVQQAQAAGKINWLRWETVNGRPAAVFTFAVEKKKSRYEVNYCCFPNTESTGAIGYPTGVGGSMDTSSLQTYSSFKPYKSTVPYHGELFIDSGTGLVVRLVTIAEFKPSDIIKQEDTRIDYAGVKVDDKMMVVPVRNIIDTEVVINGDDPGGKHTTRHTLFTAEFKDYKSAGAAH